MFENRRPVLNPRPRLTPPAADRQIHETSAVALQKTELLPSRVERMLYLIREYFGEHRVIVEENDLGESETIDLGLESLISGSAKACLVQDQNS
jgi:hypothetical protein